MDDELELLQAWRGGDRSAGRRIIEHHYESVMAFFYARVCPDHAADLTQATFETLCARHEAFEARSSLRTYVFGIARWKLADHKRLYPNRQGMMVALDAARERPAEEPSPSSHLFRRRRESLLVQALRSIPLDDQLLLELKVYESMTAAELAEVFGVPRGTIASRLRRARARLTRAVERLGRSPNDVADTLTNLDEHMRQLGNTVRRAVAALHG